MVDLYVAKGASSGLWTLRVLGTVSCTCDGVTPIDLPRC